MRWLLLIILLILPTIDAAQAAPAAVLPPASPPSVLHVVPHRAVYKMALASLRNGSDITDVSGKLVFEWRDVCDGWAIQQHMHLHFTYADGDDRDLTSTELTWESKDGKHYAFNIRRLSGGQETEIYRGKAEMGDKGGTATYTAPEEKTVSLPEGTLFPSAHTALILQQAALGEKLFSRRVFDGTDEDGSSDISVFILPPRAAASTVKLAPKLASHPLLSKQGWPVHLAFFKPETETGEPDYEMDLTLLSNGVARLMKIDYGDFAVNGTLEDAEALPAMACHD